MVAIALALSLQAIVPPPPPAVEEVLRSYYRSRASSPSTVRRCDADAGDLCFGGDPDHQRCRGPRSCPTAASEEDFLDALTSIAEAGGLAAVAHATYALSKLDRPSQALDLLLRCTEPFPCDLLRGTVVARLGDLALAERHLRAGLTATPGSIRRHLEDIGHLLNGGDADHYRRLSAPEKAAFEAVFWWLSDPLHAAPGHERWVVHIVRRIELGLHAQLLDAIGSNHPTAHEIAVTRRGFEDSWEAPDVGPFRMWVSVRRTLLHSVPESSVLAPLTELQYELSGGAHDEGFSPTYAPIEQLRAQVARFRESGAQQLAIATAWAGAAADFALVVSSEPGEPALVLSADGHPDHAVFRADVPGDTLLLSLEAITPDGAARLRCGVAPLPGTAFGLSDVLLFQPGADKSLSREAAIARMLPSVAIAQGSTVGLYWEVYGASSERVSHIISLSESGRGVLDAVLRVVGLGGDSFSSTVSWNETPEDATHGVGIELDFGGLKPGDYVVTLEVAGASGTERVSRSLRIEGDSG
jgi:hypothetical protein